MTTLDPHRDPGADDAAEWRRPADALTADEYRTATKVLRNLPPGFGSYDGLADGCERKANLLDAEAAETAFVEDLAERMLSDHEGVGSAWKYAAEQWRETWRLTAQSAIERLRPVAEWLIAERLWKVSLEMPTELPGLGRDLSHLWMVSAEDGAIWYGDSEEKARSLAQSWADSTTDTKVTITPPVWGKGTHGWVVTVGAPEQPAPRTWSSLDQVPHDVVVTDRDGAEVMRSVFGWRKLPVGVRRQGLWESASPERGPFTEVLP
ncbi:hypothetical protein ACFWQG_13170 [Rhodococcus sp. NPDC058532]|uniref:hypothetical protein n=1 Tax=Rhodococcus sp. NPDC058532 TaxID=3346540 RepID=UPI00364EEAD5